MLGGKPCNVEQNHMPCNIDKVFFKKEKTETEELREVVEG